MTIPFGIADFVYGGVIPAVIAIAVGYFVRSLLAEAVAERYALAAGFSLAFICGYVLLPSWAMLWPDKHWQFLPHLAAIAMVIGPAGLARGVTAAERWLLWLVLALFAAWTLVPTWPALEPVRPFYVLFVCGYLVVLMTLLEPLARRFGSRLLLAQFFFVAATLAGSLAEFVHSLTYGLIAGIAAAAIAGCFVSACFHQSETMTRGLIPAFVVLTGGMAFVPFVEPQDPLNGMLLLPAAPLALWACAFGPMSRLGGATAVIVPTLCVLAVVGAGAILLRYGASF